jgi:peptidyl-prolyl cis-trans isomerase SurA
MNMWKHTLLGLSLLLPAVFSQAQPVELDKVMVVVNDGVILQSDINNTIKTLRSNQQASGQALPAAEQLKEQVIDKLINDKIQLQQAERIGVRIDDDRLNQAINQIAAERGKTVEQLRSDLAAQGVSYARFREQIRNEITISEARNALVRRRINILPAEVESLAKVLAQESNTQVQYQLKHIQLRFDDAADKQALEAEANALVERLNQGEDFSQLAYSYSKGPKALQGGDWGWMRKEEMPTVFADQISTQSKGAVIGPFRSGVGFHILKIEDVKGLETVAVTEVNARHILLKTSVIMSDEGAQRQLNKFIQQIQSGDASFAELAAQHSDDPGSAAQNGELGFQTPDLYVPEFKHQVETLPVGQLSKPFQTVHGWHIVEVLDRREVDKTDAAMKNRAYRILFNRKFNEEASAWIQELRAAAYVEQMQQDEE